MASPRTQEPRKARRGSECARRSVHDAWVKTWWRRSLGSSSSSERSRCRAGGLRGGGRVGDDEIDGLAHGDDPRRLLVGHPDPIGVLELLYQRVEVERVGPEVLLEARL